MSGRKQKKTLLDGVLELSAIVQESDRASLLVAAEVINDDLEKILRAKFTVEGLNDDLQDRLFGSFTAPLYSFAMRTIMCRAFGVLPHDLCDILDKLRDMRNHCAHHTGVVTLKDEKLQSGIRTLQEYYKRVRKIKRTPNPRRAIDRGIFELSVELADHRNAIAKKKRSRRSFI